jgi:hypothetical protein
LLPVRFLYILRIEVVLNVINTRFLHSLFSTLALGGVGFSGERRSIWDTLGIKVETK